MNTVVHLRAPTWSPPVSNHFPPQIRDALVAASRTPIDQDPLARAKAIDRVADNARTKYPELFR